MKYEGEIGSYSFLMKESDVIEVWLVDADYPESYIYIKNGSIKNKKDFDYEIMSWYSKNVG